MDRIFRRKSLNIDVSYVLLKTHSLRYTMKKPTLELNLEVKNL